MFTNKRCTRELIDDARDENEGPRASHSPAPAPAPKRANKTYSFDELLANPVRICGAWFDDDDDDVRARLPAPVAAPVSVELQQKSDNCVSVEKPRFDLANPIVVGIGV